MHFAEAAGAGRSSTLSGVEVDAAMPGGGRSLSHARVATLVSLTSGLGASLLMPAVGLSPAVEL